MTMRSITGTAVSTCRSASAAPAGCAAAGSRASSGPGGTCCSTIAETTAAFDSETYYAHLKNPTALSRAVFPKFRDPWRTICSVERRQGDGIGAAALTVRGDVGSFEALAALNPARIDLLRGEPEIGQAHTTEKDLRHGADCQIEWAIVAFFWSVEDAKTARDRDAPSGEIFALQHTVSKGDLSGVS
jgi:hypothetical protein